MKGLKLSDNELCNTVGGTQLFIKSLTGSVMDLRDLKPNDTIETVKRKIEIQSGIPIGEQRLIVGGRELENGRKISDYKIKDGSTLHLVLRL